MTNAVDVRTDEEVRKAFVKMYKHEPSGLDLVFFRKHNRKVGDLAGEQFTLPLAPPAADMRPSSQGQAVVEGMESNMTIDADREARLVAYFNHAVKRCWQRYGFKPNMMEWTAMASQVHPRRPEGVGPKRWPRRIRTQVTWNKRVFNVIFDRHDRAIITYLPVRRPQPQIVIGPTAGEFARMAPTAGGFRQEYEASPIAAASTTPAQDAFEAVIDPYSPATGAQMMTALAAGQWGGGLVDDTPSNVHNESVRPAEGHNNQQEDTTMTTGHTGVAGQESGALSTAPGGPSAERAIEILAGPSRTMQGIAPVPAAPAPNTEMTVGEVSEQVDKIQQLMKEHLREGEHYGVIPGTKKKSLLKPGAEKLSFMFCLLPKYTTSERQLPNGHREFQVICDLFHVSGTFRGQGVGSCSTMEKKYRYRQAELKCPTCGKEGTVIKGKKEYGGGWLCWNKPERGKNGCGAKFKDGDRSIEAQDTTPKENPDLADTYNTVLKMAKKRAFVDANITACAASDIFTQDVADPENDDPAPGSDAPRAASEGAQETGAAPAAAAPPPPPQEFPATDAQIAKLRRLAKGNQMTFDELMAYQKYADAQGNVKITKQQATALIDAMLKAGVIEAWQ